MKLSRIPAMLAVASLLFLAIADGGLGQTNRAQVRGLVTDSAQAAVANAVVTLLTDIFTHSRHTRPDAADATHH